MSINATSTGKLLKAPNPHADQARQGGVRLPATAKNRRGGLIGLAILLIVGSAAVAGLLAVRLDSRTAVLVAARPINIGQLITRADLGEARVASEGLSLVPVSGSGQVIGKYAAQAIPEGRLLDTEMLQKQGYLKDGVVAVGVTVPAGRMPANGLQAGDKVQIVSVKGGVSKVLVASAVVSTPPAAARSGGSGGLIPGSSTTQPAGGAATVIVAPEDAPAVAAASADNAIALVLLDRGSQLGG